MHQYETNNELETIELGVKFAEQLELGVTVFLVGDLGSGKTHFVKGICKYFGVEDIITSPTFTIINVYSGFNEYGFFNIQHIDLYRLDKEEELFGIGLDEILDDETSIKLIEWPELAWNFSNKYITVKFITNETDQNKRLIEISN